MIKPSWVFETGDHVAAMDCNSEFVACALSQGEIKLVHLADGKAASTTYRSHEFGATMVKLHGDFLFTGGEDGIAHVYKVGQPEPIWSSRCKGWIEQAQFSPDGCFLAFSFGKVLRILNLQSLQSFDVQDFFGTISGVDWLNHQVVATSSYKKLSLYNASEQKTVQNFEWPGSLISLFLQPQGDFAVCGSQDQTIHIWNLRNGEDMEMRGFQSKIKSMSFHHQGFKLATADGPQLMIWDFAGKGPAGKRPAMLGEHLTPVTALQFQRQGSILASSSQDGSVFFWEPAQGDFPLAIAGVKDQPVRQLLWLTNDLQVLAAHDPGFICCYFSPHAL